MPNQRIALLTSSKPHGLDDLADDDGLLLGPLNERGWEVETAAWDSDADWAGVQGVVIRSVWDYHQRSHEFLKRIREIAEAVPVLNAPELVVWNADKRYLLDLAASEVKVMPTEVHPDGSNVAQAFKRWNTSRLVAKPTVGASAHGVRILERDTYTADDSGPILIQPFADSILVSGETSMIYFGSVFSHAVRKLPSNGDFRVQEELGGVVSPVQPTDGQLAFGERVLQALPKAPTYARIDLVDYEGPTVMEVELIEPVLYLRSAAQAPGRFAAAIDSQLRAAV